MKWRRGVRQAGRLSAAMLSVSLLVYSAALIALRLLGYEISVVMSESMQPTASRGDLVLSRPAVSYGVGDVVLLERSGQLVLHRLKERTAEGWRTQGDANATADPWLLQESAIHGRAIGTLHGFGTPLLWLQAFGVQAGYTSARGLANSVRATFWQNPTMAYSIYANASAFTLTPPSAVTVVGSGTRRIWAAGRTTSSSRVHWVGKFTNTDATFQGPSFMLAASVNASDQISAGWNIYLEARNRQISVQLYRSLETRTSVLATGTLPSGFAWSSTHTVTIEFTGQKLNLLVDGVRLIGINDVNAIADAAGVDPPSGTGVGFQMIYSNRAEVSQFIVW